MTDPIEPRSGFASQSSETLTVIIHVENTIDSTIIARTDVSQSSHSSQMRSSKVSSMESDEDVVDTTGIANLPVIKNTSIDTVTIFNAGNLISNSTSETQMTMASATEAIKGNNSERNKMSDSQLIEAVKSSALSETQYDVNNPFDHRADSYSGFHKYYKGKI